MSKTRTSKLRDKDAMNLLAANVRKYRLLSNLSKESFSTLSRIERGLLNTSISEIFALAKALEVEPKQLLDQ